MTKQTEVALEGWLAAALVAVVAYHYAGLKGSAVALVAFGLGVFVEGRRHPEPEEETES